MINKLVNSISGVFNKWSSSDTDDKLFYFVVGLSVAWGTTCLVLLVQQLWWIYKH